MDLAIKLSLAAICIFIFWRTFKMCQANPELFNKQLLGKSFTTIGILALMLIVIVSLMVISIRTG